METNIIIQGDCLEVMKDMPDNSVDLVLTDPPYGIEYNNEKLNRKSNQKYENIIGDKNIDLNFLFKRPELKIVFGALNFLEQLPYKGRWICWDKRITERADKAFGDPFEMAWVSKKTGYNKIYRVMHGGFVNSDNPCQPRFHPTQKPVALMKKIIMDFTKPNDLILDCFAGSGSTLVACQALNRRYIGIEISEKYVEIARQRLRQQILL